jgi:hypothetical protein
MDVQLDHDARDDRCVVCDLHIGLALDAVRAATVVGERLTELLVRRGQIAAQPLDEAQRVQGGFVEGTAEVGQSDTSRPEVSTIRRNDALAHLDKTRRDRRLASSGSAAQEERPRGLGTQPPVDPIENPVPTSELIGLLLQLVVKGQGSADARTDVRAHGSPGSPFFCSHLSVGSCPWYSAIGSHPSAVTYSKPH